MDARGVEYAAIVLSLFFSGMILPLVVFPGALGEVARATPWAATLQVPADVWLGRTAHGAGLALAFKLAWMAALLTAGHCSPGSPPARW